VENDLLCLDFPVFNINLISHKNNWNVLTHSHKILVPFGNVLVSDSGANVKHNDCTLTTDAAKFSELTY
jgi:hypothetical protein